MIFLKNTRRNSLNKSQNTFSLKKKQKNGKLNLVNKSQNIFYLKRRQNNCFLKKDLKDSQLKECKSKFAEQETLIRRLNEEVKKLTEELKIQRSKSTESKTVVSAIAAASAVITVAAI